MSEPLARRQRGSALTRWRARPLRAGGLGLLAHLGHLGRAPVAFVVAMDRIRVDAADPGEDSVTPTVENEAADEPAQEVPAAE